MKTKQTVEPITVTTKQARTIALVYQAGIANVIDITDRSNQRRLLQHAFSPCEWYACGLRDGGNNLEVYSANQAGDILNPFTLQRIPIDKWTRGLDDCPFRELARPPLELTGVIA